MHDHDDECGLQKASQQRRDDAGCKVCSIQKVTWVLLCGLLLLAATLTWVSQSGLDSLHLGIRSWSCKQPYEFRPMSGERLRGNPPGGVQHTTPSDTQRASNSSDSNSPRCLAEAFVKLGIKGGPWQKMGHSCLAHAGSIQPEPEFHSMLKHQSRTLPPRTPALAAHDWEGSQALQRPRNWPTFEGPDCPGAEYMVGVKIYKGVVYMSPYPHDQPVTSNQIFWSPCRDIMVEMLITVLWLYKDVPDMDLVVQAGDYPEHCKVPLPVLQFAIFNQTSAATGQRINVDPNSYTCRSNIAKTNSSCKGYTKGFTMPHPDAWSQLALSRSQLWWYSYCLHMRYITPKNMNATQCDVPRKPVVFWRGSATGQQHGWDPTHNQHFLAKANAKGVKYLYNQLLNQRVSLALMADKYPWMDIGISTLHASEFPGYSEDVKQNEAIAKLLEKILKGEFVEMEKLPQFHLVLNLDGHGPAFRLPRLFLGNAPVVKVDSIQREWFSDRALPGVHYEAVRYDLSDVAERTRLLTEEAQRNSSRLAAMALAAAQLGVEVFNAVAQIDSVAWSLMRMKEACAWEVRPPENAVTGAPANGTGEKGWHIVKLSRNRDWRAPFLKAIKEDIMQHQHHNFV